jgi:hypothetical protein
MIPEMVWAHHCPFHSLRGSNKGRDSARDIAPYKLGLAKLSLKEHNSLDQVMLIKFAPVDELAPVPHREPVCIVGRIHALPLY